MKSTSRVQRNGRVTIPVQLRKKYYVEKGDLFEIIEVENGVLLKPTKDFTIKKFKELEKEQKK